MAGLSYFDSVVLGVVEGLTEFLPVSSTGHLTIAEKALGHPVDDPAITAYTAVIQLGAIVATFIYFAKDIRRLLAAWFTGLRRPEKRHDDEYRVAWAVIAGSIPILFVALIAKDLVSGPLRSLWVVAVSLIVWGGVMWWAENVHSRRSAAGRVRGESTLTMKDGLAIGVVQCLSLVPGVSRSGATISAGLVRGLDRVAATRLSFFLAIPALTAAGLYEAVSERDGLRLLGTGPIVVGIVVAFVVAYASIAWLLRFVASNSLKPFVWYRWGLGIVIIVLLATSVMGPK